MAMSLRSKITPAPGGAGDSVMVTGTPACRAVPVAVISWAMVARFMGPFIARVVPFLMLRQAQHEEFPFSLTLSVSKGEGFFNREAA